MIFVNCEVLASENTPSPFQPETISLDLVIYLPEFRGLYPPKGLKAHAQVPCHDPVAFNPGNERVKPVQQQH